MELNERNCRDFLSAAFRRRGVPTPGEELVVLPPRMKAGREANINPVSLLLISLSFILSIYPFSISLPLDTR